MLGKSTDICEYIFYPLRIFTKNFVADRFGLAPPIFDELAKESHFRCYRWNSKCFEHVIICIPSHFIPYHFIWVSFHWSIWETCVLSNILKYSKIPWCSWLNIIRFSSVEWPDKFVPWCVTVYYEFQLIFIFWYEISHCPCFRFRERCITRPKIST